VKQVKTAQIKLNIQRLTKTFLTLSLSDLAARVQLSGGAQQAEKLILSMVGSYLFISQYLRFQVINEFFILEIDSRW
jgi:hypothetical protein